MSLNSAQLSNLLEAFPDPIQVVDATGKVLAQNGAASQPGISFSATQPLGEGIFYRRPACNALCGRIGFDVLARELMHEVRNPLSSIMTAAQLLRADASLDEETELLLGIVAEESARINRILLDFSAYLKLPAAQLVVMDIAQLARRLVAQLRREGVLPPAVEVQDDLPDHLPALADEALMERALAGIVKNAIETIEGEGHLRLWGSDGATAQLCIDDSGPGFTKESLQNAFSPFYSTRSKQTGLGLTVARAAVELSGGRVWAENLDANDDVSGARVCLELGAGVSRD